MDRLTDRQQKTLLKYTKKMSYANRRFTFGPEPAKFYKNANTIFHAINVGCHAAYYDREKASPNDSTQLVYYYVELNQADKLITVLSQLTGKTFDELTDGNYRVPEVPPTDLNQIQWQPTKEKKKKKNKSKTSSKK